MNTLIKNFYLFWQGTLLSYRALFAWLRPVTYAASKIVMPLAQMFFFVFLGTYAAGKNSSDFFVIGNAIQITSVSGIFGVTMSVGGDRDAGTLPYLFGTPANRFMIFFGRAFMHVIDGAIGVVIHLPRSVHMTDFSRRDFVKAGAVSGKFAQPSLRGQDLTGYKKLSRERGQLSGCTV